MSAPVWEVTREMFLSEEETEKLVFHLAKRVAETDDRENLRAQTDRVIIEGLLLSGLRNTEFCRLQVGDTSVGLDESVFSVRTSNPPRIVHVPSTLNERIREYVQGVRPHWLRDDVDPHDLSQPLIINERGNGYDRTALYRRVVRILTSAGLEERASVQLLRHTYGYLAYKRTGGNLLFVQRQLGHAHPMVTAVYAQFVDEPYAAMANAIPVHAFESTPGRGRRQAGKWRRS